MTTAAPQLRRLLIDLSPLRHPAYRRVFTGNAVSFFGAQFTAVAVPVQMYRLTHSSLWVGLLGLVSFVPMLIFSIWGGAYADAIDRRRLLLVSSVIAWVPTIALFVLALTGLAGPGWLLLALGAQTIGFAVSAPTRQSILPRLVGEDDLAPATTLNFTMVNGTQIFGPLAAGLLLATFSGTRGLTVAYGLDALLFTVSLWATFRLPELPAHEHAAPAGWHTIVEGLGFLVRTPILLASFAVDLVAMVVALPRALFPQLAAERFGGNGAAVGWLYAAIAIGTVLAGLTSGWISRVRRQGTWLIAAIIGWGLAVAVAGLARSLWLVVVLLGVAGAADLVSAVFRNTIMLEACPDELRGRVQGVRTAVVVGGPRLGDLRAGATAAAFGVTGAWVGGGLACAIVALLLGLGVPSLMRYARTEPVR
ncbi:MFS transporter [Hamadaea tsunoensis]|uniref:MFS transporter n=1 Tax=Hamadaea tsunoensis TaxID=53368 RepID=UPI000407EC22|nr:MFS transporter [Hamadaea tsunoensis]